jgi:hypothetical protein
LQVDVDISAGGGPPERALRRLLFVLTRFAPDVVAADLRVSAAAGGRILLTAQVSFIGGSGLALQAEDDASAAATEHFIDRLGRAVARRLAARGRQR